MHNHAPPNPYQPPSNIGAEEEAGEGSALLQRPKGWHGLGFHAAAFPICLAGILIIPWQGPLAALHTGLRDGPIHHNWPYAISLALLATYALLWLQRFVARIWHWGSEQPRRTFAGDFVRGCILTGGGVWFLARLARDGFAPTNPSHWAIFVALAVLAHWCGHATEAARQVSPR